MYVSINPTYLCNFRCSFCYLTKEQLADQYKMDLSLLGSRLKEVSDHKSIEGVDLYGGEITYLQESYVNDLLEEVGKFYQGPINIITNLSSVGSYLFRPDIEVVISWDYRCREQWQEVYNEMKNFPKSYRILMLASKCLVKQNVDQICSHLNQLDQLESVEIKPYSSNQANDHDVSDKDYENFVKKMITNKNRNFDLDNIPLIEDSINGTNNSFSDDHVFLNPKGNFSVLEFDNNDREFFTEFDSFTKYLDWTKIEKERAYLNGYCSICPYFGSCLSEHLREVKDITKSCNGYKHLLDWYAENYEFQRYTK